jgi:hypothetical protein
MCIVGSYFSGRHLTYPDVPPITAIFLPTSFSDDFPMLEGYEQFKGGKNLLFNSSNLE